jgi:hypothetical protein
MYNFAGEKKGRFCYKDREKGMINIFAKKCEKCPKNPIFNKPEFKNGLRCIDHKDGNMIDIRHKRCKTPLCLTRANKKFDMYCFYCFVNMFPNDKRVRDYKTKEKSVADFIKITYPNLNWIEDKIIKDVDTPVSKVVAPQADPVAAAPSVAVAPRAAPANAPVVATPPSNAFTGILQANSRMPPPMPVEKNQEELDRGADERVKSSNIEQSNAEARKTLMAERVNAADEARRTTNLRMAEFFAAWGSTPGNTITAGLYTLRNKIPDFISDQKEETKMRKSIDKDIADLDRLDREEKRGVKKDY